MTRVLVVEGSGNLWGSERALLDLLEGMPDKKAAVCCPPRTLLSAELKKRNIRVLPYFIYALHEKSQWQRLRAAFGVLRACLEFRPSVIYLNQSGSYRITLFAAQLLNLPVITHVRIFEDAAYLARQKPDSRRLRGLIAISKSVESEIRRFSQLESIPLHCIYDAYSRSSDLSLAPLEGSVKNRIACVGRLVPIKAQDVLIGALKLLNFESSVECLMVGDGEEKYIEQLKINALSGNKAPLIQWLGFVGDVVPLLRTCSVLVCPSHREPLGRVIFEAWDAGVVPIVYAGSGGAAEVLLASKGGLLYEKQTPESLSQAIQTALSMNQEERLRLVTNGRLWMEKNCNSKIYGKVIFMILSKACQIKGVS